MIVKTWFDPHTMEDVYETRLWEIDSPSELKTEVFGNEEYVSMTELRKHMTHYSARQVIDRHMLAMMKEGHEFELFDHVFSTMCMGIGWELHDKWLKDCPTIYQEFRQEIAAKIAGKSAGNLPVK